MSARDEDERDHRAGSQAVVAVERGESVGRAADLMAERAVGAVVVVDGAGRAVGIVTDRDLATRVVAFGHDRAVKKVGDVMSSPLHTVGAADPPEAAVGVMRRSGVRRVPVLDEAGRPIALLALDDVVAHLALGYSDVAAALGLGDSAQATGEPDDPTLLDRTEELLEGLRQRALSAAWRVESAFFDELDAIRDTLRGARR